VDPGTSNVVALFFIMMELMMLAVVVVLVLVVDDDDKALKCGRVAGPGQAQDNILVIRFSPIGVQCVEGYA